MSEVKKYALRFGLVLLIALPFVLKLEVAKANKLCSARAKVYRHTLKKLQEIDALEPKSEGENETNSSDPILLELNRMFTSGAYDK